MDKLPYLEIAKSGYRLVYYNWQSMVRLGLIPFAIILGAALINAILSEAVLSSAAGGNIGAAAGLGFLALLLNLISMAAIVPFLVAWHRFTFDVAASRMPSVTLAVTRTEWVYFGWLIALGIVMGIVYAIGGAILGVILGPLLLTGGFGAVLFGIILILVVLPGVLYLSMRFGFVFPEVALERKTDPMQSWRQTAKDHIELWLLALVVIVPIFVVGIVVSVLGLVFGLIPVLGGILTIVLHVVAMAIYIGFTAAFASALSLAYNRVVG
jgi:hypothetical protein